MTIIGSQLITNYATLDTIRFATFDTNMIGRMRQWKAPTEGPRHSSILEQSVSITNQLTTTIMI